MTKDDVIRRVARIREIVKSRDAEPAHFNEDALHQDVLRAIAAGNCDDPAGCAAEALKTKEIAFDRWCA